MAGSKWSRNGIGRLLRSRSNRKNAGGTGSIRAPKEHYSMDDQAASSSEAADTSHAEIQELHEDVSASEYFSRDMAPVPAAQRKWRAHDLAVLWISMAACVPTYMLASSLIARGMSWWQAVLTIFLGNCIVLIPMALNAHVGTRYGIPFPVYCRAAFGLRGANVPALMRALVACGWFGIQAWIGGWAIYQITLVYLPRLADSRRLPALGIITAQLACFLLFWSANVVVV